MEYIHILSCNRTRPQIHTFSLQWRIQGANPAMAPSAGHGGIGHCQLTSLTSFFCYDHHNNKRRLRFSTVFLWLTPTFLQTHFLLQGCGRWCMPLSSTFQLYFHGFRLLQLALNWKKTATGQGCKFAVSVGRPRAKMLSASGGEAPLTRGSAPGPPWGLCPQIPVNGSRSALAMWPLNWNSGSASVSLCGR